MKFLACLLSVVFIFSFSVTAFAEVALEDLGEVVPAEPEFVEGEEWHEATSGNEYLDMLLNGMQNNIQDLQEKTEVLEDEIDNINESNSVSVPTSPDFVPEEEAGEVNPVLGIDENTPTSVNVYALNPITSEDTTGLKSVLLSLIGDYDAIIVEYEYQGSNNYYNYLREVQPDYVWLCSAGIFLVIIYSVFRLGGALFRG